MADEGGEAGRGAARSLPQGEPERAGEGTAPPQHRTGTAPLGSAAREGLEDAARVVGARAALGDLFVKKGREAARGGEENPAAFQSRPVEAFGN